jgi:hypothetical protein
MSRGCRKSCIWKALTITLLAGATSVAHAARDDFPTCYGLLGEQSPKAEQRELFVVIDQTLKFEVDLKRHAHSKVHEYLQPGDRVTVLTFSAYAKGRYAQMPLTGQLDYQLDEDTRYNTGKPSLRKFDQCMQRQNAFVTRTIDQTMIKAFEEASTDLPKTELMGSLVNFAEGVISASQTPEKVILIVSDMMENSDSVSFYGSGGIASFDVEATLEKAEKANLISKLEGANVHVIGAGISGSDRYLSQTVMSKMQNFWAGYFERSGAELTGWGQPQLFSPLR